MDNQQLRVKGVVWMAVDRGWGGRVYEAIQLRNAELGRRAKYTYDRLAEDIEAMTGQRYTGQAISKWVATGSVPALSTVAAVAKILRVSRDWLAFNDGNPKDGIAPAESGAASSPRPAEAAAEKEFQQEVADATPPPAAVPHRRAGGRE